ncbi:MAG: CoA-binding protein [Planctomycetota bacterium]|nr:CoA-binding protein [Planctomycetota bacterium]
MECELPRKNASSDEIRAILKNHRIIAVVGLSDKPDRPSFGVSAYMQKHGYRIIPVNPMLKGPVLGEASYAKLAEVREPIEVVNIFRKPDEVPAIVDEAIAKGAKVIWMQEGIVHNEAAEKARAAGLQVVMNKCLLKEHRAG